MSGPDLAAVAFALVAAAHLGFQATVTLLVYPALHDAAADSTPDTEAWARVHDAHSRRIAPLVVVLYGGLCLTVGWALTASPRVTSVLAALTVALLITVTGLAAAPTHGLLGRHEHDRRPQLLRRLLVVDRWRLLAAAAVLTTAAAHLAVVLSARP